MNEMLSEVIKVKKTLESENLDIFTKYYSSNFTIVSKFFKEVFFIDEVTIKDVYLEYIYREKNQKLISKKRQIIKSFFFGKILCFFQIVILSALKNFIFFKAHEILNLSHNNFLFINRGNNHLYGQILSLLKKKNKDIFIEETTRESSTDNIVQLKLSKKLVTSFILDVQYLTRIIFNSNKKQRVYFIKILNRVIRSERFYKSKKCFDYIFDTKDNGYLPFEKSLANLYSLQLVLIQNGGRVNLSEYGYIRCNFFLGWAPIYKEIVVGKITCEEYFAIGSANLSKLNQELIYSKYTQYLGVYDLLIVEQVSLTNKLTNHINHKQFMDKIVEYKSNNPDKNIAYICRVDREAITGKFKTIIEQNDKILRMNNIVKIERQFCEIVIKKSKAIIAIDSSIRIEFCLLGKKFLSLQPTYSNNDWPSILFPDSLSLFSEEQSVFDNKLNSIINASHGVNLNFLNSKYALENFIKKVT